MQSVPESYSTPGFAAFYDCMVAQLPEEYEPGEDIELYWSLLQPVLASQGHASVLDLCTGTGRVVAGLADRLAAHPNWAVRFLGLDSSEAMLQAAARKLPPTALPPKATCSWVPGDMALLPPPADLPGSAPFDLIIISAGSFHHLLTRKAQASCLQGIRQLLAQHPAARAVVNLLSSTHLRAAPGSVTLAGGYQRECLTEALEVQPDGGRVWRQQFRLTAQAELDGAEQQQSTA